MYVLAEHPGSDWIEFYVALLVKKNAVANRMTGIFNQLDLHMQNKNI